MTTGYTVKAVASEVKFHLLGDPASKSAQLVTFARDFDQSAVLMGRLYYRTELLADLAATVPQGSEFNDAELALAMYQQFGTKGISCLEGDFSLVIWSPKESRLIGLRDPMGGYPLFWAQQGQTIALSTSVRPLRDLLPNSSLNIDYLAEFLMLPGCGVSELPTEDCVYQGIHRVRPGNLVSIHLPSHRLTREAYWNWLDRMVVPETDRLEEIGEQYDELLRQATRERSRGRVASHFSGGMDSTAVALLAAEELKPGGQPLHALSLVYKKFPVLVGEKAYIRAALQGHDDIVQHEVTGEDFLDFDVCGNPPQHEEPWAALWRSGMNRALVETAARFNADTILTGFGADEMLFIPPTHLSEMLRRGRLWAAWKESSKWAHAGDCSAWQFLYPFGIANLLPGWLRPGLGHLLHGGYASWQKQRQWTIAPWILPSFAKSYSLRGRAIAHLDRAYASCQPVALSLALAATTYNAGDPVRWSLGTPHGIVTAHPFFDSRLVRFGLGMQTRFTLQPGPSKPVLGAATRNILPESIRNRRMKAHCNEVFYMGLARNLRALERLVHQAPVEDYRILDKKVVLSCLHQAALGIASDAAGVDRLTLTLSLLKWMSMQAEDRPGSELQSTPVCLTAPKRVTSGTNTVEFSTAQR